MDVNWGYLSTMRAIDGEFLFKRLFKVAKLILVLPHSNAGEERVFSMVFSMKQKYNVLKLKQFKTSYVNILRQI